MSIDPQKMQDFINTLSASSEGGTPASNEVLDELTAELKKRRANELKDRIVALQAEVEQHVKALRAVRKTARKLEEARDALIAIGRDLVSGDPDTWENYSKKVSEARNSEASLGTIRTYVL